MGRRSRTRARAISHGPGGGVADRGGPRPLQYQGTCPRTSSAWDMPGPQQTPQVNGLWGGHPRGLCPPPPPPPLGCSCPGGGGARSWKGPGHPRHSGGGYVTRTTGSTQLAPNADPCPLARGPMTIPSPLPPPPPQVAPRPGPGPMACPAPRPPPSGPTLRRGGGMRWCALVFGEGAGPHRLAQTPSPPPPPPKSR